MEETEITPTLLEWSHFLVALLLAGGAKIDLEGSLKHAICDNQLDLVKIVIKHGPTIDVDCPNQATSSSIMIELVSYAEKSVLNACPPFVKAFQMIKFSNTAELEYIKFLLRFKFEIDMESLDNNRT